MFPFTFILSLGLFQILLSVQGNTHLLFSSKHFLLFFLIGNSTRSYTDLFMDSLTTTQRLTAAHCGSKKNKTLIIGAFKKGNSNLGNPEQRICQEWYQDPQFSYRGNIKPPFFYDFALCRLNTPVYNKEFLQVNSMANWPANPTSDLTVIGMGTTQYQGNSATALREVQVPLVPIQTCINKYSASQIKDPEIICASDTGRDACQGK